MMSYFVLILCSQLFPTGYAMPGSGGGNDFKSVVCDEDEQDNTIEWRPNVPTCTSKNFLIYGSLGKCRIGDGRWQFVKLEHIVSE